MSFDIENTTSFSKAINYFDLCPNTALIILNHFDEQVPNLPDWPSRKPIYLMPNIEMYELNASSYWNVDVVLCKTLICEQRVKKWYNQEGNPRATNVFYTKHTSPDPSLHARLTLKENIIKPKNFVDLKFLHTAGTSNQKGTNKILDCWVKRPDFPPLHVYMAPEMYYQTQFAKHFPLEEKNEMSENSQQNKTKNIFFHPIMLNNTAFGQLLAEAAIVLCPSFIEGYGHYINQARAAGALVLTTNIPPMNELIQDLFSGVLIDATHGNDDSHLLGGTYKGKHGLKNVQGLRANFDGKDVCNAVEIVLDMRPDQRYQLGIQAMKQYVEDLNYFAKQMQRLREFARQQKRIY
jgi:glycosyltransferase involved in cell wall biosynthesis